MSNTPLSKAPTSDLEKTPEISFAEALKDADGLSGQQKSLGGRLRHYLHPNGKRIHIASSPAEAENLRRHLSRTISAANNVDEEGHNSSTSGGGGGELFDVYISGTPEHVESLRHAQAHQQSRRDQLRLAHPEIWAEFAEIQQQFEVLDAEVRRIADVGVSLDAHFSRFGYSARIRAYDVEDGDGSTLGSGATTPNRTLSRGSDTPSGTTGRETDGEEGTAGGPKPLKIFQRPVVRQYFHKGILWRANTEEEVSNFELFADLLYVGIVAINGDLAAQTATGESLLRFIITFTLSWKIWSDMVSIISWFHTDDIFSRVSILFLLACLVGYTTNITNAFEHTYSTLIGFYLAARLYMAAYLALVAWLVPFIRGAMIYVVLVALTGAALWIGSVYVEEPKQLALIWVALFVDIVMPTAFNSLKAVVFRYGSRAVKTWTDRYLQFFPALDIKHRIERTNGFVSLVFGYTVVAVLYQSSAAGIDAFFGKAVLGLIQAFCYNWLYFETDAANISSHAIRRHVFSALTWMTVHLPFIMAFVLGSGALARLVVATDSSDANVDDLTEEYQARSSSDIPIGARWFYCAGFGVALVCMGIISLTHIHKERKTLRLRKRYRLVIRFFVALILILLPLAESLNSMQLIGTVTGLIVFVTLGELWACSCKGTNYFTRNRPCRYEGSCKMRDLRAQLLKKGAICLEELGQSSRDKAEEAGMAPI